MPEPTTSQASAEEVPSTTEFEDKFEPSFCENCEKEFRVNDSITLRSDGSIIRCLHWNLEDRARSNTQ